MKKEILFAYFPKSTIKRYQQTVAVFDNLDNGWQAEFAEMKKAGWEDELINEFLSWRDELDEEKIQKELEKEKIHCICLGEENYPKLLSEISDPPFCLFVKGNLKAEDFTLAVVGSRKYSLYGKQVAEQLVAELSAQGLAIVSGLAFGIDSIAHAAALQSGGRTIAVLGSGIDREHISPISHLKLAEEIIEKGGAVVSEYPPGTEATNYTFPMRNRIIAGLSLGTLVVEAAEDSGALITAKCALDYNREVFAVPQNINSPTSAGANQLIKMGAHLVNSSNDILEALNLQEVKKYIVNQEILPNSPTEAALLARLSREPIHIDELIKKSGLDSPPVNATLTLMEMKGKVKNLGGMMYILGR